MHFYIHPTVPVIRCDLIQYQVTSLLMVHRPFPSLQKPIQFNDVTVDEPGPKTNGGGGDDSPGGFSTLTSRGHLLGRHLFDGSVRARLDQIVEDDVNRRPRHQPCDVVVAVVVIGEGGDLGGGGGGVNHITRERHLQEQNYCFISEYYNLIGILNIFRNHVSHAQFD